VVFQLNGRTNKRGVESREAAPVVRVCRGEEKEVMLTVSPETIMESFAPPTNGCAKGLSGGGGASEETFQPISSQFQPISPPTVAACRKRAKLTLTGPLFWDGCFMIGAPDEAEPIGQAATGYSSLMWVGWQNGTNDSVAEHRWWHVPYRICISGPITAGAARVQGRCTVHFSS
jgi:hypothetical protein